MIPQKTESLYTHVTLNDFFKEKSIYFLTASRIFLTTTPCTITRHTERKKTFTTWLEAKVTHVALLEEHFTTSRSLTSPRNASQISITRDHEEYAAQWTITGVFCSPSFSLLFFSQVVCKVLDGNGSVSGGI